jgi:hypothetical protein
MVETRNSYRILVSKPKGRRPLGEDLSADDRMTFKWMLKNGMRERFGTGLMGLSGA